MSFEKIKKIAANNQYEFVYKKKCKSTMVDLKKLYNIKNKNYIILADEQTNGVGRRGNIWHSPKGNIYCSMNFKYFRVLQSTSRVLHRASCYSIHQSTSK